MEKIRFKDLSGWLKTVVVFGWILFGFYSLYFIAGFILGVIEGLI